MCVYPCSFIVPLPFGLISQGTWPLVVTVVSSLALGAVYSADIPRARWKSNPILAATCIFCVRAVLVQIGFSTHMTLSLGLGLALPAAIQFALVFMCILSVVIACFKVEMDGSMDDTKR